MPSLTKPFISYSIRTGIFRQPMKKNDLLTLWGETKNFLGRYTNADIGCPSFIKLKIFPSFDRRKLDSCLEEIVTTSERPSLDPIWEVSKEDLEKVINGLHNVQQALPTQPNAIELSIFYSFRFVDTTHHMELLDQEYNSNIDFIFSKRHTCSPSLGFPFTDPNPDFWNYIDNIKPDLPFELDERQLRKMLVKNGNPSSFKKVTRPT